MLNVDICWHSNTHLFGPTSERCCWVTRSLGWIHGTQGTGLAQIPSNNGLIIVTGWWLSHSLWKIWKSVGMIRNPIYGKIKKCSQPPTRWKMYPTSHPFHYSVTILQHCKELESSHFSLVGKPLFCDTHATASISHACAGAVCKIETSIF